MKQPRIKAVKAIAAHTVEITWINATTSTIDLSVVLHRYKAMAHLLQDDAFQAVEVGEWGWSIQWGEAIDIGAGRLFELAQEQNNPHWQTFHDWRKEHRLTHAAIANILEISSRTSKYYDSAEKRVPKMVALACKGWEAEHH